MSIFECKALTKNYGVKTVLDSIDLTIEPGRIVGLLGPNGSGKTTLIKLANGLLTPTSGEILIAGKAPCRATKAIVSYLPDRNTLPGWMTIAQARSTMRCKVLSAGVVFVGFSPCDGFLTATRYSGMALVCSVALWHARPLQRYDGTHICQKTKNPPVNPSPGM